LVAAILVAVDSVPTRTHLPFPKWYERVAETDPEVDRGVNYLLLPD
jgi:hypothetical protein